MKPRHLLLAGGLAAAGGLAFFGDKTPGSGIAEPVARRQPAPVAAAAKKTAPAQDILALRPREELIGGGARSTQADALFASQSWAPPPAPPPPPQQPQHPQAPEQAPPPSTPPLPFTYLGKKSEDGAWEVYLARGDQTYIVRDKSVIDPAYRVEAIQPPTMSVRYMPLNEIQVLTIGGAE